jgi:hypothetical protein
MKTHSRTPVSGGFYSNISAIGHAGKHGSGGHRAGFKFKMCSTTTSALGATA